MPKGVKGRAVCDAEGCGRPVKGWGWCIMHYNRLRDHGDALWEPPSLLERLWAKVDKNGPLPELRPDLGPCWVWAGSCNHLGYASMYVGTRPRPPVHVITWCADNGAVPEGKELDHLCRRPSCVRPSHLEPVTHQENMARGLKGMMTHCKRGHPFDEANTYRPPSTPQLRICRACREANKRRREAQR